MDWAWINDVVVSFVILTFLEIVLGIDNLVFIAVISSRLPQAMQSKARQLGLIMAWVMRLILLAAAFWITTLTTPLLYIGELGFSGRDIFLLVGGLFLLVKATQEIHGEVEASDQAQKAGKAMPSFWGVIVQIGLLDIVFSLDSILTAVGLTHIYWIMALAITVAIVVMLVASEPLTRFIQHHPSIKMLALSFLLLIGTMLIADGMHFHIPRGYVYFALGFSITVEMLNLWRKKKHQNND